MSAGTRTIIIMFAVLSALCELFGTVTVFATYRRSANLGRSILGALASEQEMSGFGLSDTKKQFVDMLSRWADPSDVRRIKNTSYNSIKMLSESLEPKWWITLGLWAYVVGALFGLAAAIVAVA